MALNVNREVEDAFYRYKMPKLAAKVEGKGNGIKTVIVNVSDIAKSLSRRPIYVTKYFGCELGAQIYIDEKNERYIVNGAHEAEKLQELLHGFIKKFVLCQACGNPETTMHIHKKPANVSTNCKACGALGQLDVTHRLTQFIVKNPPDPESAQSGGKTKKNKKSKNTEKTHDESSSLANGGDIETRHSPVNAGDDDDWFEDTTNEAQLQRMNELSGMARSLALNVGSEKSEAERASIFCTHLVKLKELNEVVSKRNELKKEADELELGPKAVLVLAEALLTSADSIVSDISEYAPLFLLFTRLGDYQPRAQLYAILAMCKLIEMYSEKNLLSKACHILKQLYDCDIVEEVAILNWAAKGASKKVVSKEMSAKVLQMCSPMIKWLQEAEEEEDSDESDEGVPSDDFHPASVGAPHEDTSKEHSDEEIDIDAI